MTSSSRRDGVGRVMSLCILRSRASLRGPNGVTNAPPCIEAVSRQCIVKSNLIGGSGHTEVEVAPEVGRHLHLVAVHAEPIVDQSLDEMVSDDCGLEVLCTIGKVVHLECLGFEVVPNGLWPL